MGLEELKLISFIVGIVIGSFMLIITCFVFLKHKKIGAGGITFSLIGVVLIGMSVWANIRIVLPGDIILELQKALKENQKSLAKVKKEKAFVMAQFKQIEENISNLPINRNLTEYTIPIKSSIKKIRDKNISIDKDFRKMESNSEIAERKFLELKKFKKN